jgi:glycine/D-amino acid oxidase-like deaminating enzyme
MKTVPYWTDQNSRPQDIQLSELPENVDVAVVGSGNTGLNAAIVLAKSGASVTVLDQASIGWGASSRNAGFFAIGMTLSPETLESIIRRDKRIGANESIISNMV